jgi:hypothetical protein
MSNEISWPEKPFYIQSKVEASNFVLTATEPDWEARTPRLIAGRDLWKAEKDPPRGATLCHLRCGLFLTRVGDSLSLKPFDSNDDNQRWHVEDLGSPWVGINSHTDWEMKINIDHEDPSRGPIMFRWDGGHDNEKWALIEEAGTLETVSVQYHMERATTNTNDPPSLMQATFIDNSHGATDLTSSVSLQRTLTTTRSISTSQSDTEGRRYTQSFGAKGGVKDVWEVNAELKFEESSSTTKSLTDETTDQMSATDTCSLTVTVPAGKRYRYQIAVYYAKFSIPFTATLKFTPSVPHSDPVMTTIEGVYDGVASTRSDVEVVEVAMNGTDPSNQRTVQTYPLPIAQKA